MSNLRPYVWLRMSVNEAQHKIINLLKTLRDFFVITCCSVLMCVPRQLFFFQCGRDANRLDTPAKGRSCTKYREEIKSANECNLPGTSINPRVLSPLKGLSNCSTLTSDFYPHHMHVRLVFYRCCEKLWQT